MGLELSSGLSFSFFPLLVFCSPFLTLYSPLRCCSPFHTIALIFALLLSFSCYLAFLFMLLLFYFKYKVFALLLSSSCYYAFLFMLLFIGVLLFIEESCINPLHSFLQELRVVDTRELKTCIFPVSIFTFAYFHFFKKNSCLLFLCFFFVLIFLPFSLWCKACYKLFWRQT
jgi:hypothetical protein